MRALALALLLATGSALAQDADAARDRMAANDFAGAAVLLESRLASGPDDSELRYLLGLAYLRGGQVPRAVPILKQTAEDEPNNVDVLLAYGQALNWTGYSSSAAKVLERAQQLAPNYVDVTTALEQARAAASAQNAPHEPPPPPGQLSPAPVVGGPAGTLEDPFRYVDRGRSIALSARRDWLDSGYGHWTSIRLDAAVTPRGKLGFYGAIASERRFGLRDEAIEVGAVVPLGNGWTFIPEAGVAPGADFLPSNYVDLRLQREFEGGWVGRVGWRRSDYRDVVVQRYQAGADRYVGDWQIGYTLNITRQGGDSEVGHGVRIARSYGDRSDLGLQVGTGSESTQIGPTVVTSEVEAVSLFGRHGFGDWAVLWNVGRIQQGGFYVRKGVTLGVSRRF